MVLKIVMGLVCDSSKLSNVLESIETVAWSKELGHRPYLVTALNKSTRASVQSGGSRRSSSLDHWSGPLAFTGFNFANPCLTSFSEISGSNGEFVAA